MADTDRVSSTEELMAETQAMVMRLRALLESSDEALRQQGFCCKPPVTPEAVTDAIASPTCSLPAGTQDS